MVSSSVKRLTHQQHTVLVVIDRLSSDPEANIQGENNICDHLYTRNDTRKARGKHRKWNTKRRVCPDNNNRNSAAQSVTSRFTEENSVFPAARRSSRRSQPGSELRNDRLDLRRFRWLSE
ncbi:unnamed protein product [Arctogadus glacialis]